MAAQMQLHGSLSDTTFTQQQSVDQSGAPCPHHGQQTESHHKVPEPDQKKSAQGKGHCAAADCSHCQCTGSSNFIIVPAGLLLAYKPFLNLRNAVVPELVSPIPQTILRPPKF